MILSYFFVRSVGGKTMNTTAYEEKRSHSSLYIPYTYYKCAIPEYFPYVPLHWHSEFELSYIREGSGIYRCGDRDISVREGDVILILPNRLHAISCSGSMVYDTIVFNRSMLGGNDDDRCFGECLSQLFDEGTEAQLPIDRENECYGQIRECAESIMHGAEENSGIGDLAMKSGLMKMLGLMIKSGAVRSGGSGRVNDINIKKALEYIRENYTSELTVKEIAGAVHLSESYFMGKFREITGMSVIGYVNLTRIRAACELLAETDRSAAEIAFEVGFRNLSNFNRRFKITAGCTPGEYRSSMGRHLFH